jgi:hypothetical protein
MQIIPLSLTTLHRIVQCSGGWTTPADRRADETPQARGGSSLAPRKAVTRSETERTHPTTPLCIYGMNRIRLNQTPAPTELIFNNFHKPIFPNIFCVTLN